MLERLIRTVALVASALVLLGFGFFVADEARSASESSSAEVAGKSAAREADPSPDQERAREAAHGDVRELVDDANDELLSPFAPVADSADSKWVRRGVPALLALLVYGVGLGFLARLAAGR